MINSTIDIIANSINITIVIRNSETRGGSTF